MALGRRILVFGAATFPWLILGCGPALPTGAKPTAPVTVTVTYKGAPVAGASIMFVKAGDESFPGLVLTDASGKAK